MAAVRDEGRDAEMASLRPFRRGQSESVRTSNIDMHRQLSRRVVEKNPHLIDPCTRTKEPEFAELVAH
jgi:hypothetical protein